MTEGYAGGGLKGVEHVQDRSVTEHEDTLDAHTKDVGEILRTGEYFHPLYPMYQVGTTEALVANTLYAIPFIVPRTMTFDRIATRVQSAGAGGTNARLGIYNNGTNLYPGTLALDAGTVAVSSTGVKAITISKQLTKGIYFLVMVSSGTPTVMEHGMGISPLGVVASSLGGLNQGWDVAFTYAALPDPFTSSGSLSDKLRGINLRLESLD